MTEQAAVLKEYTYLEPVQTEEKNCALFLVLTQTGTLFSRALKHKTKSAYNHSSISFDPELHRMYSFGRVIRRSMFPAGMVHELPDRNVYQLFPETKCAIYEIKVTEEQYKEASEFVKNMWRKRRRMTYNVPGVVTANFNHYPNFPNAYYCTQFVALVLQHIGVEFTDKSYREVQVVDFMESKAFHLIYQGELRDYWNANCVGDGYSQY